MPQHIQQAWWSLGHWLHMEMCLFQPPCCCPGRSKYSYLTLKCCRVLCLLSLPMVISVEILKRKNPWLPSLIGESLSRRTVFPGTRSGQSLHSRCVLEQVSVDMILFSLGGSFSVMSETVVSFPSLGGRMWERACRRVVSLPKLPLPWWCCLPIHFFGLLSCFLEDLPINGLQFLKKESVVPHGCWKML